MDGQRIAVISDVHGNIQALDAVLEDISRRKPGRVVNLGDGVYGSLKPAETAERLMNSAAVSISGNQDRLVFDRSEEILRSPDHRFVRSRLSEAHLDGLAKVPPTFSATHCSATARPPRMRLTARNGHANRRLLDDDESIQARLGATRERIVFCGHSHVPRTVRVSDSRLVVCPGGVGLPAYTADEPCPHVVEAGSPHARYAILCRSSRGYDVEHVQVSYPWKAAAADAGTATPVGSGSETGLQWGGRAAENG